MHKNSRVLWISEAADDQSLMAFFEAPTDVRNLDLQGAFSHVKIFYDRTRSGNRVVIKLENASSEEKFLYVMESIAEQISEIVEEKQLAYLLSELAEWSAFLAPRREGLTKAQLVGLWGELKVFAEYLIGRLSPREAVAAYCGIHDAPQDIAQISFSIEVKTTLQKTPSKITISSLEQLDSWPAKQLLVLLIAGEEDSGESVNDLISIISHALMVDRAAQISFQKAVFGKVESATEKELDLRFVKGSEHSWEVVKNFPALRRREMPQGIVSAKYQISIAHIEDFSTGKLVGDWIDGIRVI
ncbi:PD-(D/E)XK motif protein [Luminiphilus sp.]|nr:PD-(D/E)XK motif protein [Luminiphilus sp.]